MHCLYGIYYITELCCIAVVVFVKVLHSLVNTSLPRLAVECYVYNTISMCNHCSSKGNIPDIIACGSLHEFLCKAHKKYGPIISLWFGPRMFVSLGSAKLLAQQANVFDRPRKCYYNELLLCFNLCHFTFYASTEALCFRIGVVSPHDSVLSVVFVYL